MTSLAPAWRITSPQNIGVKLRLQELSPSHMYLGKNYTQPGGEQEGVAEILNEGLTGLPTTSFYEGPPAGQKCKSEYFKNEHIVE